MKTYRQKKGEMGKTEKPADVRKSRIGENAIEQFYRVCHVFLTA
jgi:hypothetical protein